MIRTSRPFLGALALAAAALVLSACVPEPAATQTPGTTPTATATSTPTATPLPSSSASPIETDRPQSLEITLPASCDVLYSSAMRTTLDAQLAPLDDPGVTLASTAVASLQGLIDSGVPTLRCTWGTASGNALSTNVSILDTADVPRVQDQLAGAGFTCIDASGGILCSSASEAHFLRGNGWVATAWTGGVPAGYTEDVASSLWG